MIREGLKLLWRPGACDFLGSRLLLPGKPPSSTASTAQGLSQSFKQGGASRFGGHQFSMVSRQLTRSLCLTTSPAQVMREQSKSFSGAYGARDHERMG